MVLWQFVLQRMISNITTFIVAGKFCSHGTERSCWCRQLCAGESSPCCPSWCKKTLKPDYFNILIQKVDLPCFHQLVTGFHGNGNGISISCFRFSAVPCQLRAVNAIWLTARIQNSSILKWQRERERKSLPSPCISLSLRIIPLYDRLSHWLMTIRHTPSLTMSLLGSLSWSSSALHTAVPLAWMVFLAPHLLCLGWAAEVRTDDQNVERRLFNDLRDPTWGGKCLINGSWGDWKKLIAFGRMLVDLSSGFSMSEITVHNHCIS